MGGEEKEAMKLTPSSRKDRGVTCVRLGGWRGRLGHPGCAMQDCLGLEAQRLGMCA